MVDDPTRNARTKALPTGDTPTSAADCVVESGGPCRSPLFMEDPLSGPHEGPREFTPTGSTTGVYDVSGYKPGERTPYTNERPLYDKDRIGPADHATFLRDEPTTKE